MPRQLWSEAELHKLGELYPHRPTKEVASALNRTTRMVYVRAWAIGLKKTQAFLDSEESGRLRKGQMREASRKTQFHAGAAPANKGLRRPGWHRGRMKETQFKKGVRSGIAAKNWVPIGTLLLVDGYLRIKIREAVYGKEPTGTGNLKAWPMYNRYVWEQHHGPIPPSHVVAFKDGDRGNCAIDNLELISRADLARRNSMWNRLPRELAEVIQLNGALKGKLRRLSGKE